MFSTGLIAVVYMGDSEVGREYRHRIAEDQVIFPIEDSFLVFGKMIQAEKTWLLVSLLPAHFSRAALDPFWIVLEANREPLAGDIPHPDILQRFVTFPEIEPFLFLFRQEIKAKFREVFPCVETGVNLLIERYSLSQIFITDKMAYGCLPHGEGLFLNEDKPYLSVESEGLPVFYYHTNPNFFEAFLIGISFCRFKEFRAHSLSPEVSNDMEGGDIDTILVLVEDKTNISGDLTL
jgi:hypothetical protein